MPDTSTEVAIASQTLGTATNTITFGSIPSTYTDLRLVFTGKTDPNSSADYLAMRFNGDTSANYSSLFLRGEGSSATTARNSDNFIFVGFTTVNTDEPELHTVDIFSYAGSTYKNCFTSSSKDLNNSGWITHMVNLWRDTSAITTITLTTPNTGRKFDVGTTVTLYGIL